MYPTKAFYGAPQQQELACDPNIVAANNVFFAFVPYLLATCIQIVNIHTALIVGTVLAGIVLLFGVLLFYLKARRVGTLQVEHSQNKIVPCKTLIDRFIVQIPVYMLDVAMLVVIVVQLGVSFPEEEAIERNFNFITNATFTGLALVRDLHLLCI